MGRLILTLVTVIVMHGRVGTLQPHQASAATGIGAYVRDVISQRPGVNSGSAAYTVVAFGESVLRPPAASVKFGW